jgi:hypothetical protein
VCVAIDGVWIGEWIYWPLAGRNHRRYRWFPHYKSLHTKSLLGNSSEQWRIFSFCAHGVTVRRTSHNWSVNLIIAPSLRRLPCRTELIAPAVLVITSLHGPHRKHCYSIVACIFVVVGTCLPSCCPETGSITPFINNLLPYQWELLRDRYPATDIHATILSRIRGAWLLDRVCVGYWIYWPLQYTTRNYN